MGQYFGTSQNGIEDKQSGTEGVQCKRIIFFFLFSFSFFFFWVKNDNFHSKDYKLVDIYLNFIICLLGRYKTLGDSN